MNFLKRTLNVWRTKHWRVQTFTTFALGLNIVAALYDAVPWLQAINWICAGACIGFLAMSQFAHYYLQRCRYLESMVDALAQLRVDEFGKTIAEHMRANGATSVEIHPTGITRH